MSNTSYSDSLKDPRWQKKRLEILQAADWACEDCGRRDKTLEVHHCFYIREFKLQPWRYDVDLLMSLCGDCHEFRQGREEAAHVALAQVIRKISIHQLESCAWDMIHDAIQFSSEERVKPDEAL